MRTLARSRGGRAYPSPLATLVTVAVAFFGAVALLLGGMPTAHAAAATLASDGIYPANGSGYDVSWPQCSGSGTITLPTINPTTGFAIVGATNGKSYNANPCLAAEVTWANSAPIPATLYMNVNGPSSSTAYRGDTGPAGSCSTRYSTKNYCIAYNYGANAAQYALNAIASAGIAAPAIWWLDIETSNTWSKSTTANDYTLEGAVDYIQQHSSATIGVYSTAYQWGVIAGKSFQPGTLAVPTGPSAGQHLATPVSANWLAGQSTCTGATIFPGGVEWLAQVGSSPIDQDAVCS